MSDLLAVLAAHRQEHVAATGESICSCGKWRGPFARTSDGRSFAAHLLDEPLARLVSERDAALAALERVELLGHWYEDQPNWRAWGIGTAIRAAIDTSEDRL